ncbi:thiolase family protein [Candidatus Woesearchaeota archaeon]|nr:thiolase family protein [Candidatus Woesearchaeota archaeon]
MYIKGTGMTRFSFEERSTHDMVLEASYEALQDSNMTMNDMDAVVVSTVDTRVNDERQRHYPAVLASLLKKNIPIIRVPAVCGGGGAALWTAQRLGYDNVLVLGVDKIASSTTMTITKEIMNANDNVWEQQEGIIFPCQNALIAQQHMIKYGTTADDLALISLKNHSNAYHNPKAPFYKKEVTLEKIKNSYVVASPFRLFDCTISVSGAAACIISSDKSDISIEGSGLAVDYLPPFEREDMTTFTATLEAAKTAYKKADISPSDINVVEVHDAFTILELIAYEDLGFCKKGEGAKLIRDGTVSIDGKLPVNTRGGLKARGHPISPTGLAQIYDLVLQLRGEAGDLQVKNHKYGIAQNIGGAGGTISVHILKHVGG